MNRNVWNLAFINKPDDIISKVRPILHHLKHDYSDRWFADPFILDVTENGDIIILAEELEYERNIGRIARLIVDKTSYCLKDMKIILELPSHLSFPFIYRYNGKIYVLPENSESGCATIYEYKNDSLLPIKVISQEPLTDATIFDCGARTYILSTQLPTQNGSLLQIREFDPKTLTVGEIVQTVVFEKKHARNAGAIFSIDGKVYRPAQDCEKSYGAGTIFQMMIKSENGFVFQPVHALYPNSFKYNKGIHTFNSYKDIAVIDMFGKCNPLMARIISKIR